MMGRSYPWSRLDARYPVHRLRTRNAMLLGVVLVAGAVIHALAVHAGPLHMAVSVISLWVGWIGSMLAHELGHALAGRAARLRPFALIVGGGPSLVHREVAGVAVILGVLPGDGLTLLAPMAPQQRLKWRLLVTYAGGPAVSMALFVTGLLAFEEQWHAFRTGVSPVIGPAAALILSNGLLLFTSIVPLPRPSDVIAPPNDLVQIAKLPWLKPDKLEELMKLSEIAQFTRLFLLGKYQAAFEEGRRLLADDPRNWGVRVQLADMLIFDGRYADAATEYATLLDEPALSAEGTPPLGLALVANNYAWANFMLEDPEKLDAADRASSKAHSLAPNHPSVIGTRGAILIALGDLSRGRKLLKRAFRLHRDSRSRALTAACLALAAAREGNRAESRRVLEQAKRLDRDCELLARAERELSDAGIRAESAA